MKSLFMVLIVFNLWSCNGYSSMKENSDSENIDKTSPQKPNLPLGQNLPAFQDNSWTGYAWGTFSNMMDYTKGAIEKVKRAKYRIEAGTNYVVGAESPPFAFVTGEKLLKAIQDITGLTENPDFEWWQLIGATIDNNTIGEDGKSYQGSMMVTSLSYYKYRKSESFNPQDPHTGKVKYEAQNFMDILKIEKMLTLLNSDQIKLDIGNIGAPTQPSGSFGTYWRQKKKQDFVIQNSDPLISGTYCLFIDIISYRNNENPPGTDFIDQMRARTFSKIISNIPLLKTIDPETFERLKSNSRTQHYMDNIKIPNALEILKKHAAQKAELKKTVLEPFKT